MVYKYSAANFRVLDKFMNKTLVSPDEFIELVNQEIKQHPKYSEDKPIVFNEIAEFSDFGISVIYPITDTDNEIISDVLSAVGKKYIYKNES